jgi:hypothetical protein
VKQTRKKGCLSIVPLTPHMKEPPYPAKVN